ncbi:accessory gland protein Acp76A [Drosophila tropicalis]|uniref:accessory gland protein Acp76A n=1 Tax=Drosophila tropicalis TaxID=46794 RepID=UPI0035ABEE17
MRENEVSSTTDLVSISGVSCKPNWKYPFFSRWKKPFRMRQALGKPYVEYVNTMYTTANFATFDEKDARGIFIPLQRTSVGMLVIVPKRRGYPRKIFQNIGNYFNMKLKPEQKLSLFLPMFRIILGTELGVVLKNMGLKQLFEGFKYPETFGSQEPITVEKFKTKTVIEVNADKQLIEIEDPAEEDDVVFEVNRPFVFLIKDRTRIYAAGRVNTLTNLVI